MENENITQNNNLKEKIFQKIKAGEVTMTSKYYFYCKVALLVFVIFITLLISAFLISYIMFSLRTGGHLFLLGFGSKGLYEFFIIFPWLILLVDIALLLFLDWLLKSFRFGYNSPIIYLFLGSFVVITSLGTLLTFTPLHKSMMRRAEDKGLPMMGGYYGQVRRSHSEQGIFRGTVVSIEGNTLLLGPNPYDKDPHMNRQITVVGPEGMDLSTILNIGDEVFVAGNATNSQIWAYGVHKLPPEL